MTAAARRRTLRAVLVLTLAAILPFSPSLRGEFVFDDQGIIVENPAVHDPSPVPAWTTRYWPQSEHAGLYRPWTTFTYWLDEKIAGPSPAYYHGVNLILHVITTLLLAWVLRRLFPGRTHTAFAVALLFAVHPLHSEAVVGIVGRAEILAGLWGLLGYGLLARAVSGDAREPVRVGVVLSALAFGLASLSKESAVGLLALPALHAWIFPALPAAPDSRPAPDAREGRAFAPASRAVWRSGFVLWSVVLLGVLVVRIRVLGGLFGLRQVGMIDNPLAHVGTLERWINAIGMQWIPLRQSVWPLELSADYSYAQLVPGPGWTIAGIVLALGVLAFLLWIWIRRKLALAWGAAWIAATGALTANIVVPIGTVYGERLTYLPLAGTLWIACLLVARIADRLQGGAAPRARRAGEQHRSGVPSWAWVPLAGIALLFAVRSAARSLEWQDNRTLFHAATETVPRSAKAWTNYASALLDSDVPAESIAAARRALEIAPAYPPASRVLGNALARSGRPGEALTPLRQAAASDGPQRIDALLGLGNAYLLLEEGGPAESTFVEARALAAPDDSRPWVGVASALALQSRWSESSEAWQNAVSRAPDDPRYRSRWAYALWQMGRADQAESIYFELLEAPAADASLRNDVAWFLVQEGRRLDQAVELARSAFRAEPNENVADTLLEALLASEGCTEARRWWNGVSDSLRVQLPQAGEKLETRCGGAPEGNDREEG